jgi:Phytanoyl-CoA dioxygenase (PhyH)
LSIESAVKTYRYWNSQNETFSYHTTKVDRAQLKSDLLRMRPDFSALERSLMADGIAVVPSYWSAEQAAAGRAEIDRLIESYPDAVHVRSGQSDKRMFGVESVSPLLAKFHHDPFLRSVGEYLGGLALYNFATLGARIDATAENNGSGDGWHRDGHGFQYKSILYLSDVGDDNGPFEFLPASQKQWRAALDTVLGDLPAAPNSRYEPAVIDRMVNRFSLRRQVFPARAGTLLLVNTAGIHRGKPLRAGNRYALTNYYYHPVQVGESRIEHFAPLMPGTADRVRADFPA